jgi:hypothetical protein
LLNDTDVCTAYRTVFSCTVLQRVLLYDLEDDDEQEAEEEEEEQADEDAAGALQSDDDAAFQSPPRQ